MIVQLSAHGNEIVSLIAPLIEAQYKLIEQSLGRSLVDELYAVLDKLVAEPRPSIQHVTLPEVTVPHPFTPVRESRKSSPDRPGRKKA